jgi:hypothetical protein
MSLATDFNNFIRDYVQTLEASTPQVKPVVTYRDDEVQHFSVTPVDPDWALANIEASLRNANIAELEPRKPVEEPGPSAEDIEAEAIMSSVIADAIADTIEALPEQEVTLESSPLEWVRAQLIASNAWDILDHYWGRIIASPSCGIILQALIEDAAKVKEARPMLAYMVKRILKACSDMIEHYEANGSPKPAEIWRKFAAPLQWLVKDRVVTSGWKRTIKIRLAKKPKKLKPAKKIKNLIAKLEDCYDYTPNYTLVRGSVKVRPQLKELTLIQSLPISELENPAFIDGYSGVVDEDADRPTPIKNGIIDIDPETIPVPTKGYYFEDGKKIGFEVSPEMAEDIRRNQVLSFRANEGFNADDEDELFEDDRDPRVPLWEEISQDFKPKNLPDLLLESEALRDGVRVAIKDALEDARLELANEIYLTAMWMFKGIDDKYAVSLVADGFRYPDIKHYSDRDLSKKCYFKYKDMYQERRGNIFPLARSIFRSSHKAKEFLSWLQVKADYEDPVDVAHLFLGQQHALAFMEEDAMKIELSGAYPNLYAFIEENEDEILEGMIESSLGRNETTADIEKFAEETLELFAKQGDPRTANVVQHPAYIKAYLTVMSNAKDIATTEVVDGHKIVNNRAHQAGWDAWREAKSPEGAKAYRMAIASGKDMKAATAAFWKEAMVPVHKALAGITTGEELRNICETHGSEIEYICKRLNVPFDMTDEIALKLAANSAGLVKPSIAKLHSDGLTLTSGRKINWYVATLKAKNNELDLTEELVERLKKALEPITEAKAFVAAIS